MNAELFSELDRVLEDGDPARGLDYLIGRFREEGQYGLLFEARLMKARWTLGLPLVQTEPVTREDYQELVVEAAREAGTLFLESGNVERAWPYFRAVGDPKPVEEAIERMPLEDAPDGVIAIAFQEGVHPVRGLDMILHGSGMCRAITAFGMTAVSRGREACIALLARSLHEEIVRRMGGVIEANEGVRPETASLPELMRGREWLFGEWDYYVDTSHLLSVIPYCVDVRDAEVLRVFAELCEYGKRLSSQFQSKGVPPFEDQFEAYGHYVQALMSNDVEDHLEYFRRELREADPEIAGDAPARALVRLLMSLGRREEALQVLLDDVVEDAPYGAPVPSALNLCFEAGDYARMKSLAREREDPLSYAAARILSAGILKAGND